MDLHVISNGQTHMDVFRNQNKQEHHEWISEFSLVVEENKNLEASHCDIEVPCIVQ